MDIDSIRKAQAKLDADRDALIPKHMRAPIVIHTLKDLRGRGKNLENCIGVCRGKGGGQIKPTIGVVNKDSLFVHPFWVTYFKNLSLITGLDFRVT